jgi:lysophospholipase L1-like esterase
MYFLKMIRMMCLFLLPLNLYAQHHVSIEGKAYLSDFYASLSKQGQPEHKTRITHVGDSHVIADIWTSQMRKLFQNRFSDGGRGWVLVGKGWRSFAQSQISYDQVGDWSIDTLKGGVDDGFLGLAGCSFSSKNPADRLRIINQRKQQTSSFNQVFIHTLGQPQGGQFLVKIDGVLQNTQSTQSDYLSILNHVLSVSKPATTIELMPMGDGEVRFLSVSLEKKEGGILYDALGLNGAQAKHLLRNQRRALNQSLALVHADLLILSYGINELYSGSFEKKRYEQHMRYLLDSLLMDNGKRNQQNCLLTGAFSALKNGRPIEKMGELYDVQASLAKSYQCAFWDAHSAMGKDLSIWQNQGWAQNDGVHLTAKGYEKMAELLFAALMENFEE